MIRRSQAVPVLVDTVFMPLFLVSTEHPDSPVAIDKPIMMFGRQAECDVILTCSRKVSRRHCCLVQISDWIIVRDLGSTNGVSINGRKIKKESRLTVDDELTIGDVTFEFVNADFPVQKGKVCIGPPFKSIKTRGVQPSKGSDSADRQFKPGELAKNFRGIKPPREADKAPPRRREEKLVPPDDIGSETFGSDAEFEEPQIDETFDSNASGNSYPIKEEFGRVSDDSDAENDFDGDDVDGDDADSAPVDEDPFAFLNDDDELEDANDAPAPRRRSSSSGGASQPQKRRRAPVEEYDEDDFVEDAVFDGDFDETERREQPASRPAKKQRPRDVRLRDDEQLADEAEVRRIGGKRSEAMDSIIELDEFDLLD